MDFVLWPIYDKPISRRRKFLEVKRAAFERMSDRMCEDDTINLISMDKPEDFKGDPRSLLRVHAIVCYLLKGLPVETFVRWFPIDKSYNGERTGTKDYFYTRDYLSGKERIEEPTELLLEYQNWTVAFYMLNMMSAIDQASRAAGIKTPLEMLLDNSGIRIEALETYYC